MTGEPRDIEAFLEADPIPRQDFLEGLELAPHLVQERVRLQRHVTVPRDGDARLAVDEGQHLGLPHEVGPLHMLSVACLVGGGDLVIHQSASIVLSYCCEIAFHRAVATDAPWRRCVWDGQESMCDVLTERALACRRHPTTEHRDGCLSRMVFSLGFLELRLVMLEPGHVRDYTLH